MARILVVEDEKTVALDIRERLASLGYEVPALLDRGEEAVKAARDLRPDLVLMDIMLKGEMDGVKAAESIRQDLGIPVIYLTAYSDAETLSRARVTEPYGYLIKPFEGRELHSTIEMALYRHRAEKKILEAQEWLSALLKGIGDAVIAMDTKGMVTFLNPQAEKATGWAEAEALGRHLAEVFDISGGRGALRPERCMAAKAAVTGGGLLAKRAGGRLPVEFNAAPVYDPSGGVSGAVVVFKDISERLRAEATLRESEERFRTVVQSANDAIVLSDGEGNIFYWNKGAKEIFGYAQEEVLGRPISVLMPERYRDAHTKGLTRVRAGGENHVMGKTVELQGMRRDGSEFPIDLSLATWRTEGDTYYSSVIRDVTERKKAEEALEEVISELDIILENASVGIALVKQGMVLRVNREFEELFERPRKQLKGEPVEGLFQSAQDYQDMWGEALPLLSAGKPYSAERLMRNGRGGLFWCSVLGKAIDPSDPTRGTIWIVEDITERIRFQTELKEAKEAAEAANRAKSEFLANVSHEIRTPMNGIIGMTELALETELGAEQRQYLDAVKQSADSLLALLNDILDFSKIEARRLEIEDTVFDLEAIVGNSVGFLFAQAATKGLEHTWRIEPEVPALVRGDPARLRQVLVNLVGNAVKFTERGEVSVLVEKAGGGDEKEGGATLCFSVSDTGIGIASDKIDAVFDGFTQADGSTTRLYGGTGLGLAISRHLVEMMGGRIWAESHLGKGSRFYFTISFGLAEEGAFKGKAGPAPSDGGQTGSRKGLRILLAEDNAINQMLARSTLEKRGHSVAVAGNGREALSALAKGGFDLVLMDIQMPEMDGIEATRIIRASASSGMDADIPIVAVTAHAMGGDKERFLKAGMDEYIAKPFKAYELFAVIDRVVSRSRDEAPEDYGGEVIDRKGALARLGGDEDLLRELWCAFAKDIPLQAKQLAGALEAGETALAERVAHSLKSAAGSIGAMGLRGVAKRLESAAGRGDRELSLKLNEELGREVEKVLMDIRSAADCA